MKFELSVEEMIKTLKWASLGKLMTGLIHNLNSPLQNIGMDIELATMLLKNRYQNAEEIAEKLTSRLTRMEKEFDRINRILKRGTINLQLDEYYLNSLTLNLFIQQVLKMLEANLYFKHQVNKEMDLKSDLSKIGGHSENFWLALMWFMQSLVDNIEKNLIKELTIKTDKNGKDQKLVFRTKEGKLSDDFLKALNEEPALTDHTVINEDAMLAVALHVLRSKAVIFNGESSEAETTVTLHITR